MADSQSNDGQPSGSAAPQNPFDPNASLANFNVGQMMDLFSQLLDAKLQSFKAAVPLAVQEELQAENAYAAVKHATQRAEEAARMAAESLARVSEVRDEPPVGSLNDMAKQNQYIFKLIAHLPKFKAGNPVQCQSWLLELYAALDSASIPIDEFVYSEIQRGGVIRTSWPIVALFNSDGICWWNNRNTVKPKTWQQFVDVFHERWIPRSLKEKCWSELRRLKLEGNKFSTYQQKFEKIMDRLLGAKILKPDEPDSALLDDPYICTHLVDGLTGKYQAWMAGKQYGKDYQNYTELVNMLNAFEADDQKVVQRPSVAKPQRAAGNSNPPAATAMQLGAVGSKNGQPPTSGGGKQTVQCGVCKKKGHQWQDCHTVVAHVQQRAQEQSLQLAAMGMTTRGNHQDC